MKPINSEADIKKLGRILGIWAHPDDDVFSMGMIMAAAHKNGQMVECVIATRGEAGVQDESRWPASELANIRTKELESAYKILGKARHHWLDYPDGGCDKVDSQEAVSRVAKIIKEFNPDTILTFGPDGMTGHPDHKIASDWTKKAVGLSSSSAKIYHSTNTPEQLKAIEHADKALNIFFNIDEPPVCKTEDCDICVSDYELCVIKLNALKAMPSQTEALMREFEDDCMQAFGTEAFSLFNK